MQYKWWVEQGDKARLASAMTSLILDNADLSRLFPKCRPRLTTAQGQHNDNNQNDEFQIGYVNDIGGKINRNEINSQSPKSTTTTTSLPVSSSSLLGEQQQQQRQQHQQQTITIEQHRLRKTHERQAHKLADRQRRELDATNANFINIDDVVDSVDQDMIDLERDTTERFVLFSTSYNFF